MSTVFSTVTGTTSSLTTVNGTSTIFIATVTGTGTTTRFLTSTSYIGTTSATLTSTKTLTSFTTTFEMTTASTSVVVVPGFTESSIMMGLFVGVILLILSHRGIRAGNKISFSGKEFKG